MKIEELRKSVIFRVRRKQLLVDTINDLKGEGLSYKSIAKVLGTYPTYVSNIIHNHKSVSDEMVEKYLKILKV